MENDEIINLIKSSFCNLTSARIRNNFIEIITGYSTINFKFISVFIHKNKNGKYIVSDYGWLDQNYYDISFSEEQEEIAERIKQSYLFSYDIKQTEDVEKNVFYYKSTNNISNIPSLVFDLSNFLVGVINAYCLRYKDEKDEREKENFRIEANNFLKQHYNQNVKLDKFLTDLKNIKFNAIIFKGSKLNLLTYVTGSTPQYFENGLRKSIVNFEISEKSIENKDITEKISIINDSCDGFVKSRSESLLELLQEKTTRHPILWSEKEKILEII
ncbi:hypothetical protein J2786_001742 [Chryseobacterium vietnamense]|jgi:hypothetical protein|uniref:Uncharacterized protein n=1 Tax=Chryseobacterium vietnamense TaxID=866785 RepID=A0ACC6J6R9_9FLAO|nr:hypothetical protein [Chryseobacterium vietnamense]MDR6458649.1 hypothetical protein [Chryseobacterium vietnamense]